MSQQLRQKYRQYRLKIFNLEFLQGKNDHKYAETETYSVYVLTVIRPEFPQNCNEVRQVEVNDEWKCSARDQKRLARGLKTTKSKLLFYEFPYISA